MKYLFSWGTASITASTEGDFNYGFCAALQADRRLKKAAIIPELAGLVQKGRKILM
jgi:hypothetical protein